jgi:hypothetical protein
MGAPQEVGKSFRDRFESEKSSGKLTERERANRPPSA